MKIVWPNGKNQQHYQLNKKTPNQKTQNQTHKAGEIHQQKGYRDSTEQSTSRILFPIADAQEKKGLAVGKKGDRGLIIKHAASLIMPVKAV